MKIKLNTECTIQTESETCKTVEWHRQDWYIGWHIGELSDEDAGFFSTKLMTVVVQVIISMT